MKIIFALKRDGDYEKFMVDDDIYEMVSDKQWRCLRNQAITEWKNRKAMTLHRFVMTMEQDITGKVVKFKDGNFRNCQRDNLYVTDKFEKSRLNWNKIKEFQRRYNEGESEEELIKEFRDILRKKG